MRSLSKPRLVALVVFVGIVAVAAALDGFARTAFVSDVRADTSARLDGLARSLNDMITRETAAADTMAVFVELTGFESLDLDSTFPVFAEALMQEGPTIRSVQLAPGGILEYVHPVRDNEEAVGLDLFADPVRRLHLLPSIQSGNSVLQGPFDLVQGGRALAVRHPVYRPDGSFWGFAAVILDWDAVTAVTGLATLPDDFVAGIRLAGERAVIAGDPAAFEADPLLRSVAIGSTDTRWTLAMRPAEGWPTAADASPLIWAFGLVVGLLAAVLAHNAVRRPELAEAGRAAAVAELARSEATFQATVHHAGVGILIGDISGRVVQNNPAFAEIVGRADESLAGAEVIDFIAEEDRRPFERELVRAYRLGTLANFDVRIAGLNRTRWGRVRVSTIPGDERLFVGIVEDITDRLAAEAALAESEDRFRRLFEHAPIAIQRENHSAAYREIQGLLARGLDVRAWYEEDDRRLRSVLSRVLITDLNPAAVVLQAGRLGAGASPGPLVRHYTPKARDGFLQTLQAMAEGRTTLEYEVITNRGDQLVHLDMKWQVPVVDGEPDYGNVMLSIHDSTALRDTERRLQEEVQSKDRFLASVAHELRTPLTAVVGFAHEIQNHGGVYSGEEVKEFQHLIAFHSSELANLIEDLLVWARADIGEVQVRPHPIDLARCVAECVAAMPDFGISFQLMSEPVIAFADPARVRQIVRNLVTNAVRYGGPDPRILVTTEGEWSVISVSDDGAELPAERREAIFAPYTRSEASPSMPGSIGLGLTVSRTLARLQGGDLVLLREGDRNIFRVTLPQSVEVPAAIANL